MGSLVVVSVKEVAGQTVLLVFVVEAQPPLFTRKLECLTSGTDTGGAKGTSESRVQR
jgi:hypothetical protein